MRGLAHSPSRDEHGMETWLDKARGLPDRGLRAYQRMGKRSKNIFWGVIALHVVILLLVIIITPSRIGRAFNSFGEWVRDLGTGGMFLMAGIVILTSHPPLFGFSASMSLIGFAYGLWPGCLIAALASMVGSGLAFLSVRTFFSSYIKLPSNWKAFERVMKEKGTILVIMIRWCPMPWAIGNGAFASIESVKFWQFMLASLVYQPKLFIPVFIGSRLTSLADPDAPHSALQTWLNILSIGLTILVSAFTGIWIYRLTLTQIRKMEGEDGEGAAEALEGLEEGLLAGYRDETMGEEEAEALVTVDRSGTTSGSRSGRSAGSSAAGGVAAVSGGQGERLGPTRRMSGNHDSD